MASDQPTCGKCGGVMTPENARVAPELFLHDNCLPDDPKEQCQPKPMPRPTPPKVTDSIPPNRAWPEALDSLVGDPFSLCRCGHERQQHAPQGLSCHPGDGPCVHLGCECSGFTVQPTPPRPAVPEPTQADFEYSAQVHYHMLTTDHSEYSRDIRRAWIRRAAHAEVALAASREENAELRQLLEARKGEYE